MKDKIIAAYNVGYDDASCNHINDAEQYASQIECLLSLDNIKKLAEQEWTQCHGCDENDKQFWINGFIAGYLLAI
jgi:hypothetical protein